LHVGVLDNSNSSTDATDSNHEAVVEVSRTDTIIGDDLHVGVLDNSDSSTDTTDTNQKAVVQVATTDLIVDAIDLSILGNSSQQNAAGQTDHSSLISVGLLDNVLPGINVTVLENETFTPTPSTENPDDTNPDNNTLTIPQQPDNGSGTEGNTGNNGNNGSNGNNNDNGTPGGTSGNGSNTTGDTGNTNDNATGNAGSNNDTSGTNNGNSSVGNSGSPTVGSSSDNTTSNPFPNNTGLSTVTTASITNPIPVTIEDTQGTAFPSDSINNHQPNRVITASADIPQSVAWTTESSVQPAKGIVTAASIAANRTDVTADMTTASLSVLPKTGEWLDSTMLYTLGALMMIFGWIVRRRSLRSNRQGR
jgi:hypothetical protein